MNSLVPTSSERPFAHRTAFLLNANARAVNADLAEQLAEVVPAGDLFFSRSLEDAEIFVRTIARRGYRRVLTGGGDGTLVAAIGLLRRFCAEEQLPMPALGVLKLGTGNAVALALGAQEAIVDANHIVQRGDLEAVPMDMVDVDGELTPFAGLGWDGAVLNDYVWLKKATHHQPLLRRMVEGVGGYLAATLGRTVPREARKPLPRARVTTKSDAILMVHTKNGDVEQVIPAGTVLHDGPAPIISVGSIPFYGFGFTMFPFAGRKPGYIQLRVGELPIPTILLNLFPRIWSGRFRHPSLRDFLVKDVVIESDEPLPFQVGGDARGHRNRVEFKVSDTPVHMLKLAPARQIPVGHTLLQLGPARMLVKLPR
jgi:diacylglycerol kinase family enzyme